jgi:hypothetical protein
MVTDPLLVDLRCHSPFTGVPTDCSLVLQALHIVTLANGAYARTQYSTPLRGVRVLEVALKLQFSSILHVSCYL